jgi:signal peptidase I
MWRYAFALAACTLLAVLALRQRFVIVTVNGDSMVPALAPGDRVLVRRVRPSQLRRGQVVVVEMPDANADWTAPLRGPVSRHRWMIKRVAALSGDPIPEGCLPEVADVPGRLVPNGKLFVLGDNITSSHDSRHLGYLPSERLLGIVIRRVHSEPFNDTGYPTSGSAVPPTGKRSPVGYQD